MSNRGFNSSAELASILNVSTKTVARYIKDLNETLNAYHFKIESKPGVGYGFIISEDRISLLRKIVNEQILPYKYIDEDFKNVFAALLEPSQYTIQSLASKVFMSETSLRFQLDKIKYYLESYKLSLAYTKQGFIQISGNKEEKVNCIANYIQSLPREEKLTFLPTIDYSKIKPVKECLITHFFNITPNISDADFDFILHFILACANEINCGNFEKEVTTADLNEEIFFSDLSKILSIHAFENYQNIIRSWLQSLGVSKNGDRYPDLRNEIITILSSFHISLTDNLIKNEKLIDQLLIHMTRFIERSQKRVLIENLMINDIKKGFPLEFSIAYYLCREIGQKYHSLLNEDEIGFIAMYLAAQREILQQHELAVAIICHYGMATANLLKEKIQKHFPSLKVTDIFSYAMRQEAYKLKPDYIISSINLTDCPIPYIFVKDILGSDLVQTIKNEIITPNKIESLINLIPHDAFYQIDSGNQIDAIEAIGQRLVADKLIDPDIIDEVLLREKISSTEIGNLVAIPHTLSAKQANPIIALALLNKPVKWGNDLVQLIFFVAFNEENKSDVSAFRALYHLVEDKRRVNYLINHFSYMELLDLINNVK